MRGGAFLKGKEGRVGFRKTLLTEETELQKTSLSRQKVINEAITQSPL